MKEPKYDLEERLLEFSVRIIRVTESMKRSRAANHIADQLLRSGTSPYGNHGEAEGAESRDDFIHKMNPPRGKPRGITERGFAPMPAGGIHPRSKLRGIEPSRLTICYKELRESRRWLRLVQQAELIAKPTLLASLITEADELVRIFASSIRTAQKNRRDT
jgi:hypothetical protein